MEAVVTRRDFSQRDRVQAVQLWSGLSSASKRLIVGGAGLMLLMVAAVALMMWEMRIVTQTDVRQNVGKLGIAITEQTARSIQAVDLALQDLRKDIIEAGIDTPQRFQSELRNPTLHEVLRQKDAALPQADAFTIVAADGSLVNFSRQWPIPPTNLSDRDYYQYFRDHDDPNPYISNPVRNRGNGGWTAYVVRRVNGPSGAFLGLVLGALDLNYFRDFYKALTVGAGTTVTLLTRDGTALTSFPETAPIGSRLSPSSAWHGIVARRISEAFEIQGVLAPGLRIVSVHPLLDYPLAVNVSVSEWESLANWRKAALLATVGTACAVLGMLLLLRALVLQLQRLEHSQKSLAEQNVRLEMAGHRLEAQAEELRVGREDLAEKSSALETTLGHMSQGILMVDPGGTAAVYNSKFLDMLDLPAALLASRPTYSDVVAYQRSMQEFDADGTPPIAGRAELPDKTSIYERKRPNGRILEIQSVPLEKGGMVRTYTDVTERRISEEQVRYFAHHDDLTKLVNRVVFQERLGHALELADRTQRSIAVLYLDLDRFKLVNDTKGHGIGDKLLVQVAARLRSAVRDIDTVARMGGDEFAIIQPLIEQQDSSARLAERLLLLLTRPFDIEGTICGIGVSIGIALYPDHAINSVDLLRNADTALYRAKTNGRGGFRIFDQVIDGQQLQEFGLERELRQALDQKQFVLEYQPIIDTKAHRVVCFEALLRWRNPERGVISPADFVGLAESSGLIIPIGLWVLEAACIEAASWPDDMQVAVNLSPLQFSQENLVDQLTAILRKVGLAPNRLVLEVTEGLLLQHTDVVLGIMSRLRTLGVRISLDDFGTAHAGLSYLWRFPFDTIKIDKSFVQEMVEHPPVRAIVAAVLGMGIALDLNVIAEGVETQAQLDALQEMRCSQVQGYLMGRPRSAADARKFIAESHVALG